MPIENVVVNEGLFGNETSLIDRYKPPQELPPPKLNLKLRKSDIRILETIANQAGTTRSHILNDLVNEVLLRMLNEIHGRDRNCAFLLARFADIKSGHNPARLSGWSEHLFADQTNYDYYWDQELPSLETQDKLSKQFKELAARLTTSGT